MSEDRIIAVVTRQNSLGGKHILCRVAHRRQAHGSVAVPAARCTIAQREYMMAIRHTAHDPETSDRNRDSHNSCVLKFDAIHNNVIRIVLLFVRCTCALRAVAVIFVLIVFRLRRSLESTKTTTTTAEKMERVVRLVALCIQIRLISAHTYLFLYLFLAIRFTIFDRDMLSARIRKANNNA